VRPFDGVRVLDLTRVLAGPTATGFLAAWGADVLRIDPPGFPEVAAVQPTTTCGKRPASLDLTNATGRQRLMELVAQSDVVVHGYRSDALRSLGLDPDAWHDVRPGLVEVTLDAYGWDGPWARRRGFDSIVQHSVGITAVGQAARGSDRPVPLPCQALDHGCGWLMAAAVSAGLSERCRSGHGSTWRTSLEAMAALLTGLPRDADPERPSPVLADLGAFVTTAPTAWGPLRRLRWPGRIGGIDPLMGQAGPIGAGDARW
jgi:crotonobetainyl-CoA:carnitine CoA-transferase CaiB-like acyl-CoA transferase